MLKITGTVVAKLQCFENDDIFNEGTVLTNKLTGLVEADTFINVVF